MCDVDVMLYMYLHVSVIILLVLDWMQNKFWIFESESAYRGWVDGGGGGGGWSTWRLYKIL